MCPLLPHPSSPPPPSGRVPPRPPSPLLSRHPCHHPQSITPDGRRMGSPRGSHDGRPRPRGPTQRRSGDCAWVGRVRVWRAGVVDGMCVSCVGGGGGAQRSGKHHGHGHGAVHGPTTTLPQPPPERSGNHLGHGRGGSCSGDSGSVVVKGARWEQSGGPGGGARVRRRRRARMGSKGGWGRYACQRLPRRRLLPSYAHRVAIALLRPTRLSSRRG